MAYFTSCPDKTLIDLWKENPSVASYIYHLAESIMRGDSHLSPGYRELIAAYVSFLNNCEFCYQFHSITAALYDKTMNIPDNHYEKLDLRQVVNAYNELALLQYITKLTKSPESINQSDIDEIVKAGWEETSVIDATFVCSFFCMINRIVDGLGLGANASNEEIKSGAYMLYNNGYMAFHEMISNN